MELLANVSVLLVEDSLPPTGSLRRTRSRRLEYSLANIASEQPYLDSDMQSRWYDFGGDTIVRTDSYATSPPTLGGTIG